MPLWGGGRGSGGGGGGGGEGGRDGGAARRVVDAEGGCSRFSRRRGRQGSPGGRTSRFDASLQMPDVDGGYFNQDHPAHAQGYNRNSAPPSPCKQQPPRTHHSPETKVKTDDSGFNTKKTIETKPRASYDRSLSKKSLNSASSENSKIGFSERSRKHGAAHDEKATPPQQATQRKLEALSSDKASSPEPTSTTIEIAPGVRMRLRGAAETWKAVEEDFYSPSVCLSCSDTIFCIQDADYVLCPVCRVVSPTERRDTKSVASGCGGSGGGVGLGFTIPELAKWQEEILQKRYSLESKKSSI